MVGAAVAMALQAAAWQPLPPETAIPWMTFICTPEGESRPDFRRPWWQIEMERGPTVDRARVHQLGDGHTPEEGLFDRALTGYERQERGPGHTVWRISYVSGPQSLVIEYSSVREADRTNMTFVWQRLQGVMRGRCDQAPFSRPAAGNTQ